MDIVILMKNQIGTKLLVVSVTYHICCGLIELNWVSITKENFNDAKTKLKSF